MYAYPAPSNVRYDYKERIELMEKLADIDRNMNTTTKLQRRQACKYNKFYELRRNVLEVAKSQINSVDFYNLSFDYEAVCAPGGKRVVGIHFTIYDKKDYQAAKEGYEQMELPLGNVDRAEGDGANVGGPEVVGSGRDCQSVESLAAVLNGIGVAEYLKTYERYPCTIDGMKMNEVSLLKDIVRTLIEEIFDLAVKQKTIQNIICAAEYQQVRIVENLLYVKKMHDKGMAIDNLEGYLTAAVKEDYAASERIGMKSSKGSAGKRAGSFERRQYNMEELESELLKCKGV